MFAHMLVPLDGSVAAEKALPVAARSARASRGTIHLLTVVRSPLDLGEENNFEPQLGEQEIESGTTVASDYLRTMVASPVLDGIPVTTEIAPWTSRPVYSGSGQVRGVRSHGAEQSRQDGFQALGAGQRCAHACA